MVFRLKEGGFGPEFVGISSMPSNWEAQMNGVSPSTNASGDSKLEGKTFFNVVSWIWFGFDGLGLCYQFMEFENFVGFF